MKLAVYTIAGAQAGDMEVADGVFAVKADPKLVQFVVRVQRANAFRPYGHTKTRDEVRGGGRKPWRQKGTGRARQGSIRSPQWKGGGIVFGPRIDRRVNLKVNQKERQAALRMVLSDKAATGQMIVVDDFSSLSGKTKEFATFLGKTPVKTRRALVASAGKQALLQRASRNIPQVNTVLANSLNVLDLLNNRYLVVDKAGVEQLQKQLS